MNGFDINGFDADGFDSAGFDIDGYDRDGYNSSGYDIDGYDRDGFDVAGYDIDGYDADGYDSDGYNRDGLDRDGNPKPVSDREIAGRFSETTKKDGVSDSGEVASVEETDDAFVVSLKEKTAKDKDNNGKHGEGNNGKGKGNNGNNGNGNGNNGNNGSNSAVSITIPKPQTTGFSRINDVDVDGEDYKGKAFVSPNRSMYFYQLRSETGFLGNVLSSLDKSEQLSLVLGTRVERKNLPKEGVSVYNFLPDLNIHLSEQKGIFDSFLNLFYGKDDTFGYFDYNIADGQLLPDGTPNADIPTGFGLAIDWKSQRFMSGSIDIEGFSSLKLVLGRVNTEGDGPVLDGKVFEFSKIYGGNSRLRTGAVEVNNDIFGTEGTVDGFVFDGITPNPNVETVINQPLVLDETATIGTKTTERRRMEGYMGGFLVTNVDGNYDFKRYWTQKSQNLRINTRDHKRSHKQINANIWLRNADDKKDRIRLRFGPNNKHSDILSAYISDDLYAVEQRDVRYHGKNAMKGHKQYADDVTGVLVSGKQLNDFQCEKCEYVHWGVWAAQIDRDQSAGLTDLAHMMPYIAGEVTRNLGDINLVGDITYRGIMLGSSLTPSRLNHHTGNFSAVIDMNNRLFTDFMADIDNRQFGFNNQAHKLPEHGRAQFRNLGVSGSGLEGTINGALFGPQAEDIGGNYNVTGSNYDGIGVYLGTRK